jgi:hypothetical protein
MTGRISSAIYCSLDLFVVALLCYCDVSKGFYHGRYRQPPQQQCQSSRPGGSEWLSTPQHRFLCLPTTETMKRLHLGECKMRSCSSVARRRQQRARITGKWQTKVSKFVKNLMLLSLFVSDVGTLALYA